MANQDWRKQVEGFFDFRNPGANPNWRDDATNDIKEMMGFGPAKPTMLSPNAGLIRSDNPRAGRDNWNQDPQFIQDQKDLAYLMPGSPEYKMMLRRMGANLGKTQAPAAAASAAPAASAASATPAAPATGAPAPSTAASRFPPAASPPSGSDVAEENRSRAIGAQGTSPTTMSTGAPAPAAVAEKPPSDPNLPENKYPPEMIEKMEKDLTDLLTMRAPTDPAALQQWRKLIETKRTELTSAKSAYGPQAGMGMGIPILASREAAVRADNIVRAERQTAKDNDKAKDVLKQAQEHYKGDPKEFNTWLKSQGYTETGHKFKENMFDKAARQKAEDPKGQNPNNFTPAQQEAIKTQRAKELEPKPITGMDTVKSQLKQMLDAGFIDEATFRKGMNDPYSHGQTIQAVYDQYVQKFNPHPNSPFPENSA